MRIALPMKPWLLSLAFVSFQCGDDAGNERDGQEQAGHAAPSAHADADATAESGEAGGRDASGIAGGAPAGMTGAAGGATAGAAGSPAPPPDDGMPTWTGIYTYEFRTCKNPNCHGKGLAGIDMSDRQRAYDSLVEQSADAMRECATTGLTRVVPGDPDKSLLYLKLDIKPPCGQQMPPGGSLGDKTRDRVRAWIAAGAMDD